MFLLKIYFALTIFVFYFNFEIKAQVACSDYQTPPPNNPDGSGAEWYPYSDNQSTTVNIYGYPSSSNKFIDFILHFGARQWKLNYLHVQRYNVYYLGTNEGPDFSLPVDENTKTDHDNQIDFILSCDLRVCKAFGNHQCSLTRPNSPFGHILVNIEIPSWDKSQLVNNICQGEKPIDLSTSLINILVSKYGGQIKNARYYVDGQLMSNSFFDPSQFSPGIHIITAQKTYCNSDSGWGHDGDFVSEPFSITVTSPNIQFPSDNVFLCTNSSSYTLLANPTGGTWADINNPNNQGLSGNIFDPSKVSPGTYKLTYTYVDPETNCTGKKNFSVIVNQAPKILMKPDTSVFFNSNSFLLTGDQPLNGVYSGSALNGNYFNPKLANLCDNAVNYTVIDSVTKCSTSKSRIIKVIPIVGKNFSLCNNAQPYNLLKDVNPVGGAFSGPGIEGNNFNPQSLVPGDYTVTYSITGTNGCISSNSRIISVLSSPEPPLISGNVSGCNGDHLLIQASVLNNNNNIKFIWYKKGDSIPFFNGNNLNYTIRGNETIICFSENSLGCISNPGTEINIISNNPIGDFSADTTVIKYGGIVNFRTNSVGLIYNWDFGDGGQATKQNPAHYYYSSGTFPVRLSITSSQGCTTSITKNNYIKVGNEIPNLLTINQPIGNGFDSSINLFNIYPSPFSNYIRISCQLNNNQNVSVNLFDLNGHLVIQNVFQGKTGDNLFTINNLNMFQSGVYYILKVLSKDLNHIEKVLKL